MNLFMTLPLLIPIGTAIILLFAWRNLRMQRVLTVFSTAALLLAGVALLRQVMNEGISVLYVAAWPAPFGITLVADLFSAIMVLMTGMVGFLGSIYSLADIDEQRESYGYYPLLQFLLLGVCGAFLTGDVFNLFVWFEVMLIASFVLLALGGERAQLEGAVKYVTLNLLSSALFLAGVGVLYSTVGTLNMADIAEVLNVQGQGPVVTGAAMLLLVAFGIKAAAFPLFFWLPASYHTPPLVVSAIFAGLLTKVGVYALVRIFTLLFIHDLQFTHSLLLVMAALTMVTGVLGAVAQTEMSRLLSFHIVSQIGYLLMGLALYTELALAGTVFFMIHVILAKANLFLVAGIVRRVGGTTHLKKIGGLYLAYPLLSLLFLISAMSLAGIPPLSGFWAKLILVRAGLEIGQYLVVGVSLGVGLLTLFSMTKIWAEAFWKPMPQSDRPVPAVGRPFTFSFGPTLMLPIVLMAALTLALGLAAEPVFELSVQAAAQLLDPQSYIRAVKGY